MSVKARRRAGWAGRTCGTLPGLSPEMKGERKRSRDLQLIGSCGAGVGWEPASPSLGTQHTRELCDEHLCAGDT